jgi:hypothetical protein
MIFPLVEHYMHKFINIRCRELFVANTQTVVAGVSITQLKRSAEDLNKITVS